MRLGLVCPFCGLKSLEFEEYTSMILLAQNLALVQFSCPTCQQNLSVALRLTQSLHSTAMKRLSASGSLEDQADANKKTEAGAHKPTLSHAARLVAGTGPEGFRALASLSSGDLEHKALLTYFRHQLESVDTVDDALQEIDSGYRPEKRDS